MPKKKREVPVVTKTEFAPPEPETDICPLCGVQIPEDTLRSPKILCEHCHRPIACPSCKEEVLKPVGITSCPWCKNDPKSTEKIQQALFTQQEWEEIRKREGIVETGFNPVQMMTSGMIFGSVSSTQSPYSHEYPYRDPPKSMSVTEGWGVPPTQYKKPKINHIKPPKHDPDVPAYVIKEEAQRGTGRTTQKVMSVLNHLVHRPTLQMYDSRHVLFVVDNQRTKKHVKRTFADVFEKYFNKGDYHFEGVMTKITIKSIDQIRWVPGVRPTLIVIDLMGALSIDRAKDLRRYLSVHACPIVGDIEEIPEKESVESLNLKPIPKIPDDHPQKTWAKPSQPLTVDIKGNKAKLILSDEEIPLQNVKIDIQQESGDPIYGVGKREPIAFANPTQTTTIKGTIEDTINANEVIGVSVNGGEAGDIISVHTNSDGVITARTRHPISPGDVVQSDPQTKQLELYARQLGKTYSRTELPPSSATRCMKCGNSGDHCTCRDEPKMSWWKRIIKEFTDYYPLKFNDNQPHRRPKKCPTCNGDEPSSVPHLCPYDEDINAIHDVFCWCCHDCEDNCAMDI